MIGCGNKAFGDVNIDLYPEDRNQCSFNWDPKKVKNFVLADAQYLPFIDNAFNKIYSSHVLEHIPNPLQAVREMKRVCFDRVYLLLPSQFLAAYCPAHVYSWNPDTLKTLLRLAFENVETGYTKRLHRGLGGKVAVINLFYKIFKIYTELYAVCS